MLSIVVLFSQQLPGRPCIFPAILYCIFPLIFRHSQPRSSRFLLLCLLFLSSQPTPGSIQFFDSFSSHSQPCLFFFYCFPCAAISHPLDPSSVTLPRFPTSCPRTSCPTDLLPQGYCPSDVLPHEVLPHDVLPH